MTIFFSHFYFFEMAGVGRKCRVHRQKKLLDTAKDIYFSDGAASQHQNKTNFINLAFHKKDFGVPLPATSHGKGPCDGVGGTAKHSAARSSLQTAYEDQIQTLLRFEWAGSAITKAVFNCVSVEEVAGEEKAISSKLKQSVTVPCTKKCHAFHEEMSFTNVKSTASTTSCSNLSFGPPVNLDCNCVYVSLLSGAILLSDKSTNPHMPHSCVSYFM